MRTVLIPGQHPHVHHPLSSDTLRAIASGIVAERQIREVLCLADWAHDNLTLFLVVDNAKIFDDFLNKSAEIHRMNTEKYASSYSEQAIRHMVVATIWNTNSESWSCYKSQFGKDIHLDIVVLPPEWKLNLSALMQELPDLKELFERLGDKAITLATKHALLRGCR